MCFASRLHESELLKHKGVLQLVLTTQPLSVKNVSLYRLFTKASMSGESTHTIQICLFLMPQLIFGSFSCPTTNKWSTDAGPKKVHWQKGPGSKKESTIWQIIGFWKNVLVSCSRGLRYQVFKESVPDTSSCPSWGERFLNFSAWTDLKQPRVGLDSWKKPSGSKLFNYFLYYAMG